MRVKEGELQDVRNLVAGIGKVGARMGESVGAGGGVVVTSTTRPVGSHGGDGLFMQSVKVRARRAKVHRSVARNISSEDNNDRSNSNGNGHTSSSSSSSGGSNNRSDHSNGRNSNRPRRLSTNRPRAASMSPFDEEVDEEEWHQRFAFTPPRSYSDPATPLDATTEEAGDGYPGGGWGRGGTRGVEGGGRRSLSPAAAETKYRDVGPPSSPSLSPSSPAMRSPSSTSAPSSTIAGIALPHALPLLNTIDDSGSKRVLEL